MFVTLKKDYLGHKAGATLDIHEEAVAKTMIDQGLADALQGDPYGPLMAKATEAAVSGLTKNLDAVINKALEEIAKAQSKSRKNAVPLIFGDGGEGDPQRSFGDWCLQVAVLGSQKAGPKAKAAAAEKMEKVYKSPQSDWSPETKAALGESSGVTGGYIVPPDFYQQLLAIAAEDSTFRQRAFVQPMASATLQFPYLDITTAQASGNSPFFGGVIAYWTSEAQTRTETEPQFKMMELKAQELSGYSVSSNILLQDAAFGLEKFLFTLFGKAVAWYEEYAFLQGNGVGKPLGLLNAAASIKLARNTAGHFYFQDVAGMLAKLLPASYNRAVWYVSPTVVSDMLQLKDGANRAIFISIDQGVTKPPVWKLLNLPVNITEKLPALGTTGDVMLCDPSLYVIGDRMQLEVAASEHVNFLKNQMTWRFVQRVDGKPWLDNPITLQDGASQVSPFVILHARVWAHGELFYQNTSSPVPA
jgi:HK97 family phage major capsid protein